MCKINIYLIFQTVHFQYIFRSVQQAVVFFALGA